MCIRDRLRTIVKAVGELDITIQPKTTTGGDTTDAEHEEETIKDTTAKTVEDSPVDPITYIPSIVDDETSGTPEWLISETDIDFISKGKRSVNANISITS